MVGTVGCSNAAGGSEITNGGDQNVEHKFVADICGEEHKCKVAGCIEHGYTHPAYMNVTAEFEGQRFVEAGTDWQTDNQGYTKYTARYNDADKYINCKVTELNNLWQKNNTGSALSNQIGNALSNFNNGASISGKINNNYAALAPVFVTMEDNLTASSSRDYNRFKASYHKLAANAYNNSLGHLKNSPDNSVLTNKEMKNLPENPFVDEVIAAGLTYDELDVKEAQNIMNNSLTLIAQKTTTNTALLKKVVELALYNESLYGLNDLAKLDNVVFRETLRQMDVFDDKIYDERRKTRMQSIDDRTM